jgi:hypothetical protein
VHVEYHARRRSDIQLHDGEDPVGVTPCAVPELPASTVSDPAKQLRGSARRLAGLGERLQFISAQLDEFRASTLTPGR